MPAYPDQTQRVGGQLGALAHAIGPLSVSIRPLSPCSLLAPTAPLSPPSSARCAAPIASTSPVLFAHRSAPLRPASAAVSSRWSLAPVPVSSYGRSICQLARGGEALPRWAPGRGHGRIGASQVELGGRGGEALGRRGGRGAVAGGAGHGAELGARIGGGHAWAASWLAGLSTRSIGCS